MYDLYCRFKSKCLFVSKILLMKNSNGLSYENIFDKVQNEEMLKAFLIYI